MTIKKVAIDKVNGTVCGITFDTEAEAKLHLPGAAIAEECDDNWVILDFDHDPAVDYLTSLELNASGDALVNPFAGKTIAEQTTLCEKRDADAAINKQRQQQKHKIKMLAKEAIDELKWKIDRAKDLDAINGNTDALRAAYQEREDIRVKSNAMEAELNALTTLAEVTNYNTKEILKGIID
tara:strand:- start:2211 stop:2753 length:543 start_codon:yes stop_codon:yes gene_type:complete